MTFVAFFDCCHSGGIARAGGARVRGLNPPDDIRHRLLRWNWAEQVWEPRDLASERSKTSIRSYVAANAEYAGKDQSTNRMLRGVPLRQLSWETYERRKKKFSHQGPYQPLIFEACQEGEFAYEYVDGATSYGGYTYFLTQELFAAARERREVSFKQLHDRAAKLLAKYYNQTPQLLGPAVQRNAKVPMRKASKEKAAAKRAKRT
jgi:hypothetical protein